MSCCAVASPTRCSVASQAVGDSGGLLTDAVLGPCGPRCDREHQRRQPVAVLRLGEVVQQLA
eukprot:9063480-Pyramimonas_sp.AAC.1